MPETPALNDTIFRESEPILNNLGVGGPTDPRCRIELFGGLRLLQGDRVLTRFRTHKAASLLAYLALHLRQSHPRDQLVDLFWPEMELEAGRVNLSTALSSLRRPLEPPGIPAGSLLIADRRSVQLNPDAVSTDVAELDLLLRTVSRTEALPERTLLLERAVNLYRGELLPGCFEEWALLERARCSGRWVDALEALAAAREESGELEGAVAAARQAVAADPYREETYRVQMRCLAAQSRAGAALEAYRTLEEILKAELGISPAAATRELAARLRRDPGSIRPLLPAAPATHRPSMPPALPGREQPIPPGGAGHERDGVPAAVGPGVGRHTRPSAVATLPLQLTRFFGREGEIADLTRRVEQPETRLLTLTGPGGAGKTRLAIEVARRLAPAWEGRVWFVELAALPDPNLISFALAHTLKLPMSPNQDPLEAVVRTLEDTPCLLLLDNVEHLLREGPGASGAESHPANKSDRPAGATALVRLLLERVPQLTCLATSRQPLHLGGEQEFPVPPLGMPTGSDTPERLLQWGSVALYADRAQLAKPDFALTERNAEAVARLCRKLEGMPLAIEMAAAWAKTLPPGRILERLERQLELLVSRRRDLAPRHQSLRATIEWSYELLSPKQRRFFAQLSVFRGGWTLEAAEAVARIPMAGDPSSVVELLEQLRLCSLLYTEEVGHAADGEVRYRLLEALREFAAEQLSPEERAAAERRHAEYFLALAEEAEPALKGPERGEWMLRLEQEHDNLRAALDWSLAASALEPVTRPSEAMGACGGELGLRLAAAMAGFWFTRGFMREGRERLAAAMARMGQHPGTTLPGMLPTLPTIETNLDLWIKALHGAGTLALAQSDFGAARAVYEQRLALQERRDDAHGVLDTLLNLATVAMCEGSLAAAHSLYERSVTLAEQIGDHSLMAASLSGLGGIAELEGDYPRASAFFQQSVPLAREAGARGCLVWALHAWGFVTWQQGDVNTGRALLEESMAMFREAGHRYGMARTLERLGGLALALGQTERAARLYGSAASLREAISSPLGPLGQAELDRDVAAIRASLGKPAFAQLWAEGCALTLEEAIDYALSRVQPR